MTNEVWTPGPQQETALQLVYDYCYRLTTDKPPFFYLGGHAGTGKTTLAKHFAAATPGAVVSFASYTGKAALVLRNKGCHDATTIDRLIYKQPLFWICPSGRCTDANLCVATKGLCQYARKQFLPKHVNRDALDGVHMVIIDEVSMVGPEHGQDLLSFKIPVLVLGDPNQLPPITGTGFFTSDKPDYLLTEIHRQAADNPIIQMSIRVREGRLLQFGDYGDSHVIEADDIDFNHIENYGQVIVGRNETRVKINKLFRKKLGYDRDDLPRVGETLICLRNDNKLGILNGELFIVQDVGQIRDGFIELDVTPRDDTSILSNQDTRRAGSKARDKRVITVHARIDMFHNPKPDSGGTGQEFDYGYAITVHKAQGSEYEHGLLIDESYAFPEYERRAHLYTGVTRFSKSVTVARRKKIKRNK